VDIVSALVSVYGRAYLHPVSCACTWCWPEHVVPPSPAGARGGLAWQGSSVPGLNSASIVGATAGWPIAPRARLPPCTFEASFETAMGVLGRTRCAEAPVQRCAGASRCSSTENRRAKSTACSCIDDFQAKLNLDLPAYGRAGEVGSGPGLAYACVPSRGLVGK
jgi:hypothetical protein